MIKRAILTLSVIGCLIPSIAFSQEIDTVAAVNAVEEAMPSNRDKFIVDEVVAVVGRTMILLSDLKAAEREVMASRLEKGFTAGRDVSSEALETLLMQKLLSSQAAIDSLPITESNVFRSGENMLNALIEYKGSVKAVEALFNKPIFAVKDYFMGKAREQEMAKTMQREIQKDILITPTEVSRYVRKLNKDSLPIIPEQYVYAQIVRAPEKSDNARMDVKEKLLGLRKRILDGESFGILARLYSEDMASAALGGEMDPSPLMAWTPPFSRAVESLKTGQISEVVESDFGFHIIELLEKKNDLYRTRHILCKIRFSTEELQSASKQLDSLATEVRDGKTTFEKVAADYSDDKDSKFNGGLVVNSAAEMYGAKMKTTRFFKEELKSDYTYIQGLKVGGITNSFQSRNESNGDETVKVVKILDIVPAHIANIKDDYSLLEDVAINNKKSDVFNEWLNKKIDEMYIRIEEPYRNYQFKNPKWVK